MAFTCGFFNSENGDRKYNAEQMSAIFDGIIADGVFTTIGDHMAVSAGTGMQVLVGTGKAWFDHTWNVNDAAYPLAIAASDVTLSRIDAIVLETNHSDSVRLNKLRVVQGTVASSPVKPTLTNSEKVHQHPLAWVTVAPGVTQIAASAIENAVGTSACPFVTGIIETTAIDDLFNQWNGEFDEWFDNLKAQLSDNVVANLQKQIDANKTAIETLDTESFNARVGDKKCSNNNNQDESWLYCNGEYVLKTEYPLLAPYLGTPSSPLSEVQTVKEFNSFITGTNSPWVTNAVPALISNNQTTIGAVLINNATISGQIIVNDQLLFYNIGVTKQSVLNYQDNIPITIAYTPSLYPINSSGKGYVIRTYVDTKENMHFGLFPTYDIFESAFSWYYYSCDKNGKNWTEKQINVSAIGQNVGCCSVIFTDKLMGMSYQFQEDGYIYPKTNDVYFLYTTNFSTTSTKKLSKPFFPYKYENGEYYSRVNMKTPLINAISDFNNTPSSIYENRQQYTLQTCTDILNESTYSTKTIDSTDIPGTKYIILDFVKDKTGYSAIVQANYSSQSGYTGLYIIHGRDQNLQTKDFIREFNNLWGSLTYYSVYRLIPYLDYSGIAEDNSANLIYYSSSDSNKQIISLGSSNGGNHGNGYPQHGLYLNNGDAIALNSITTVTKENSQYRHEPHIAINKVIDVLHTRYLQLPTANYGHNWIKAK